MTDLPLLVSLPAGVLAGGIAGGAFYGGLGWTVRRLTAARRPGVLVASSFALRLVAVAAILLAVATWLPFDAMPAAVVGLLAARSTATRGYRRPLGSSGGGDGPWT